MRIAIRKGLGFGLTSSIITTLGLIVGLYASTASKLMIVGGILIIAIADSLADAMGMHISEESEKQNTTKQVWESTISTFISKFIFAMTFIIPLFIFPSSMAIVFSIFWGLILIALFSLHIANLRNINPTKVILEHITIAIVVIIATHFIGKLISTLI